MQMLKAELANKLTQIACRQVKVAYDFKRERMGQVQKSEEFYYGRKIKVPRGRFGVPFPTMSGFVDTLMSKIDDPPVIKYGYTDLADLKLSNNLTKAIAKDSSGVMGNWAMKDRWSKKLACFSGRAIAKYFAESDPKYKSNWEIVDHEDFLCEPAGGGHLEKHLFLGQDNVFRSRTDLHKKANFGIYDRTQVDKLIASTDNSEQKKNKNLWQKKAERYKMLGLNISENTYVGQEIYRLIEWAMEYNGKRYYLLFDYLTETWVRAQELKEVFESELWPWHSWATHEDSFIFWSKAPCDDVRPIADAIDVIFNQALDNRQKRNMGQRAYDANVFPDPSELEWRPDGLVRATPKPGQQIAQGIYSFQTPEVVGTIDLVAYMDNFLGRKSGITPEAQGAADKDQKVGIYYGSLQQVADRLGLYNKSYNQFWEELGLRYAWGAKEHLSEAGLMAMIGTDAVGWYKEREKAPHLDLTITGGSAEIMANAEKAKKRADTLVMVMKDPELKAVINPVWRAQETLKFGSYENAEIKMAMSREEMGNIELMSEAEQAIQEIKAGKSPKLNRGANTDFMQRILDFATDEDVDMKTYDALIDYAQAHRRIVIENMNRKLTMQKIGQGVAPAKPKLQISEGQAVEEPVAGSVGSPISLGNKASNILRGTSPQPA